MANYEWLDETNGKRYSNSWWRIAVLVSLYLVTTSLVFLVWHAAYEAHDDSLHFPPPMYNVPHSWTERALLYANAASENQGKVSHDFRLVKNRTLLLKKPLDSRDNQSAANEEMRLVCYYSMPSPNRKYGNLRLQNVNSTLCTHINVGVAYVANSSIVLPDSLERILLEETAVLRQRNPHIRILIWIGSGDMNGGFKEMVKTHKTRKLFIQSLKQVLSKYHLDGCDLDWEFPSAYNKERQHFSQLLYEIRQEYIRERRSYLLSVAVAAPEGIAFFAYDISMINQYADYANVMTYDYHFYSRGTPFTGLNAPLYPRSNEHSILATLNINYTVNWWLSNGLDRNKLVVGLPTYGHSFTLVNPFNTAIGAPAENVGRCGEEGFASYTEVCWFNDHNLHVSKVYDEESCSPYLSSGTEWISYENDLSVACKTRYVKMKALGGVMIFSLNTDDFVGICEPNSLFPLIRKVRNILWS